MSKTAYLRDGEIVELHETLDNGQFIIERMYTYSNYEGYEDVQPCGKREVVQEVFLSPPIEKKHDELINLIEKTEAKNKELLDIEMQTKAAKQELSRTENFKTDLKNHIINRSELLKAKRLTVFSGYKEYDFQGGNKKNLRLTYSVELQRDKLNAWVCNYDGDYGPHGAVNDKYGILIDATDEEIIAIGKEIVRESKNITDVELKYQIPEKYLTEELKIRKHQLLKNVAKTELDKLEKEIKEKQKKFQELKSKHF